MKKAKFQTLAEAIEAGEPSIADKIISELNTKDVYTEAGEILKVEKAYKTLSGAYVILARQRTIEEQVERARRREVFNVAQNKADIERITAVMKTPGYILIAWHYHAGHTAYLNEKYTYCKTMTAYYLPETGPRRVYSKHYHEAWRHDKQGRGYITAVADFSGKLSWEGGRKTIGENIKKDKDSYVLCAPLWLLTSIPEPRPRFLAGEE